MLLMDTIDLYVFDKNDKLVVKLDSLSKGDFVFNASDNGYKLLVRDVLFNEDILKFASGLQAANKNDYLEVLNGNEIETEDEVIEFGYGGENDVVKCKLIAKTIGYNPDTNKVGRDIVYEIPNALLIPQINLSHENGVATDFNYEFSILPYDSKNKAFKMHLKKRK